MTNNFEDEEIFDLEMPALINREGLTFEEWICAAGLRIAWLNGVDPSEYRKDVL